MNYLYRLKEAPPYVIFSHMNYFVAQVQTGKEETYIKKVLDKLGEREKQQKFIFPKRRLSIRRQGKKMQELQAVFPGYIFIETPEIDVQLREIMKKTTAFCRFLRSNQEIIPLQHKDVELLRHFTQFGDIAESSRIYFDANDRIAVTAGPLVGLEGCIIKIDRRKQRAKVKLDFSNEAFIIDLGFEIIEKNTAVVGNPECQQQ